ncbi:MAG TPA: malectin [Steroidobacteraceae bacterium]|nr:malectin [Steroidobacteraceae bacterium]
MNPPADELAELHRVLELLGRSTRSGRLLAHVGSKYFNRQDDQLTEFNIATEVFGRSPTAFVAVDDAVVRVEAHRLRKRLREIYATGTGVHGLQISLPPGSYLPRFERGAAPTVAPFKRRLLPVAIAASILAAVVIGFAFLGKPPAPLPTSSSGVTEVHLMSGYDRGEVIDDSGVRWTSDRYFKGGTPWAGDKRFIRRTSRPFLFANWRTGEFEYAIPAQPGVYELRLYFLSALHAGEEKIVSFDVALAGNPLLLAFDANVDAMGVDVADERVFRDVVPDKDGMVRLQFTNRAGTPSLNALELVPGIPHKQRPIRIVTQAASFVDHQGQRWRSDDYYLNGYLSTDRRSVTGTENPELFASERFGHFSYAIPVDVRGRYTVVLHFAEFYFGPELPGGGGVGSRIFHVYCNGKTLLEDFDVFKEGGSLRVVTKKFEHIRPSAQGKINLVFEPVVNNATVSGIEVLEVAE